jgi:hypothetical protein
MGLQKRFRLELERYTPGLPSPKDTHAQQVQQQQLRMILWLQEFICEYRNLIWTLNATRKLPSDLKASESSFVSDGGKQEKKAKRTALKRRRCSVRRLADVSFILHNPCFR